MSIQDKPQTVAEFCTANRISKTTFYRLARANKGPEVMRLSARKVLITREAAEKWREEITRK